MLAGAFHTPRVASTVAITPAMVEEGANSTPTSEIALFTWLYTTLFSSNKSAIVAEAMTAAPALPGATVTARFTAASS